MYASLDLLTALAMMATVFSLANAYSRHDEPRIRLYGRCAIAGIAVTAAGRLVTASPGPAAWVAVAAACFGIAFSAWHTMRQRAAARRNATSGSLS